MIKKILIRWIFGRGITVFVKPSDQPRLWDIEVADSDKRRKILTGTVVQQSSRRFRLKDYQLH